MRAGACPESSQRSFISNDQTPEVLQPGKQPLDFPPSLVSLQATSILSRIPSIPTMWRNEFNAVEPSVLRRGGRSDRRCHRLSSGGRRERPSVARWTWLASLHTVGESIDCKLRILESRMSSFSGTPRSVRGAAAHLKVRRRAAVLLSRRQARLTGQ
jgi:hypothetical protein